MGFAGCQGMGGQDVDVAGMILNGTGTPTIVSDSDFGSGFALQCAASGNSPGAYYQTTVGSVFVASVRFKFTSGSSAQNFIHIGTAGTQRVQFNRAGGSGNVLRAVMNGVTTSGTTAITDNVVYTLDVMFDGTANPWTLDWFIDGKRQEARRTAAVAAATANRFLMGWGGTTTGTARYGDLVLMNALTDFPIGRCKVPYYPINGDGAHNISAGGFTDSSAGAITNATTTAYTFVDEVPILVSSDYVQQANNATTEYIEFTLADPAEGLPVLGIRIQGYIHSASTLGSNQLLKINDNGTVQTVNSVTSAANSSGRDIGATGTDSVGVRPSTGGPWTDAALAALRLRWGFSSDASPDVRLNGAGMEVAYLISRTPGHEATPGFTSIRQAVQRAAVR